MFEQDNLIVKQNIIVSAVTALVVVVVLFSGFFLFKERIFNWLITETVKYNTSLSAEGLADPTTLMGFEDLVISVVERSNPAVVSIAGFRQTPASARLPVNDPFFESFFRQFGFSLPEGSQTEGAERRVSGGSGFFVSADGLILTNRHVVEDGQAIYRVTTNEGREYEASVVATDDILDVAVLQIEVTEAPVLSFGSSRDLKLGQTVIVIGNALGEFQNTVSVGVVSGLSRSIVAGSGFGRSEFLDGVIQTDAAINQGNSGGPMLNLSGQVVGMSVATAFGSDNIGFALPAESLKQIADSVIETGEIVRPYIGVRYLQITTDIARQQNLGTENGALIVGASGQPAVEPDSPAGRAGLREGDIITHFNGEVLMPGNSLSTVIRRFSPGDEVTLRVLRGEERLSFNLILGGI